ncbi:hypothetical protein GBAR_LOCUS11342 [Geodia barretti]|nr:hypothetical protein GBAR_LOCUS11342 [Geodia barretti]
MSVAGQMMTQQQSGMMGQPGIPAQTMSQGTCGFPGCPYGRRVEGNKVHPYCSRTCAQKHSQLQGSFHAQKIASASQAGKTGTPQATPVTSAGAHAGQPPPNAAKATAAASTAPAHSDVQKVHSKPSKPGKELVRVVLSPETLIIILYKTL